MVDVLEALAKRCEEAEGRDRDLNVKVHEAFGRIFEMEYWSEADTTPQRNLSKVPDYTGSMDAAMTLVPKGYDWIIEHTNGGLTIGARVGHNDPDRTSWASTAVLALVAASLRARQE